MKLEDKPGQDIPVDDLPAFKKVVKKFGEAYKDELGDPTEPKDSRFSSPEGTWNLLTTGLKKANLADVKSALVGKLWEDGKGFTEASKSQLRELGRILSDITITGKTQNGNYSTLEIIVNESGDAGAIQFINFYGNWKLYHF